MFKINHTTKALALAAFIFNISQQTAAQDNSPLSRFGLGDEVPQTNAVSRGMGGVSAAYNDYFSINYANPASYAFFQSLNEQKSRKLLHGRAVLDIGLENNTRTLSTADGNKRFTTNNILFSHVMLGMPLRKNWGMALGIRPVSRIGYKIYNDGPLHDAGTNAFIDSAQTLYEGTGGTYLASLGTGVKVILRENDYLSFGVNAGYMFGKKDYSTRVTPYHENIIYTNGFSDSKTSFGNFNFNAGVQYQMKLKSDLYLGLGASGTWQQKLKANRDNVSGTYIYSADNGYTNIDTSSITSTKGDIIMPASYTAGFILQKPAMPGSNKGSWLVGVDYSSTLWNNYRFLNTIDNSVANNWNVKLGAEFRPAPKTGYFSNVSYRIGFRTGTDYIVVNNKNMPVYGMSIGGGFPLRNFNYQARTQATFFNLAFEYNRRGDKTTVLKDDQYRLSLGFSLTDLWFVKRRYQ